MHNYYLTLQVDSCLNEQELRSFMIREMRSPELQLIRIITVTPYSAKDIKNAKRRIKEWNDSIRLHCNRLGQDVGILDAQSQKPKIISDDQSKEYFITIEVESVLDPETIEYHVSTWMLDSFEWCTSGQLVQTEIYVENIITAETNSRRQSVLQIHYQQFVEVVAFLCRS